MKNLGYIVPGSKPSREFTVLSSSWLLLTSSSTPVTTLDPARPLIASSIPSSGARLIPASVLSSKTESSSVQSLPDELILEIFRRLESQRSRDACSLVCKRWLSLERFSRTTLRIGNSFSPDDYFFSLLSRRFLHITSIHLDDDLRLPSFPITKRERNGKTHYVAKNVDADLTALAHEFPRIEKLSLIWCPKVTSVGLCSLAEKCTSLRSLDLQFCSVGDQGLAVVGKFSNQLEELKLNHGDFTDVGVIDLVVGCAMSLKSISVAGSIKITDLSLEAVGSHCKSLEVLFLDSKYIHDKGLIAVAQGCSRLKDLTLQRVGVTDKAFAAVGDLCTMLERLALYSYKHLTDKGMQAIGKGCNKLKNLTLSDCYLVSCKGLEAIADGCKELTRVEINGCHNFGTHGLEAIGKSCTRLEILHLEDCSGVGDKGIIAVGKHCKSLTELSLQNCVNVGDQALIAIGNGCSLQQLNLRGCKLISDVGISAIAKGCPQLTHLDISLLQNMGDMALVELGEGCPMLKDLALSHCNNITNTGLKHLVQKCTLLETCHISKW